MLTETKIYISANSSLTFFAKPEEYGIVLGENGYTNVDELIKQLNAHNENINFEILQHIVNTNNKKRFAFNDDLWYGKQHFKCKQ